MRSSSFIRPRRALLALALLAAALASLMLAGTAFADALTPESGGSPNADDIHELYVIVLVVAAIVFIGVEGALIYSIIRFRKSKSKVAAQIHGNTRLEIGWTIGATVIVLVLSVLTLVKLDSIIDPPASGAKGLVSAQEGAVVAVVNQPPPPGGKGLTIDVNGQQYVWRYEYPGNVYSYEEMVAPVDTTVILKIRAQDVAHSWWIPKLGGKFDAIPGYTNETWFKIPADKAGSVFTGQCAELCGTGHANMIARVRAVTPDQFRSWIACQKALLRTANQQTLRGPQRQTVPPEPLPCRNTIT